MGVVNKAEMATAMGGGIYLISLFRVVVILMVDGERFHETARMVIEKYTWYQIQ